MTQQVSHGLLRSCLLLSIHSCICSVLAVACDGCSMLWHASFWHDFCVTPCDFHVTLGLLLSLDAPVGAVWGWELVGKVCKVCCLLPAAAEGQVLVDGVDLSLLDAHWYRSNMGVVAQEPRLFSLTVRDNITYGCPFRSVHCQAGSVLIPASVAFLCLFCELYCCAARFTCLKLGTSG